MKTDVNFVFATCAVCVLPLCTGYHIRDRLERREIVEVCTTTQ